MYNIAEIELPLSTTLTTRMHDDAELAVGGLDVDKKEVSFSYMLKCRQCQDARKQVIGRHMLYEHLH
jgi:hypothetical protein